MKALRAINRPQIQSAPLIADNLETARYRVLNSEFLIPGIYFSQTSVIYFCRGFNCCSYYRHGRLLSIVLVKMAYYASSVAVLRIFGNYTEIMQVSLNFASYHQNYATVEPVYNGHPRDLRNWPLNTGSLKILTGRCLMSILMVYHTKKFHARKQ